MTRLKQILCKLQIHDWVYEDQESFSHFTYCKRCGKVIWFTGEWSWDLDICDTRKYYHYVEVWP